MNIHEHPFFKAFTEDATKELIGITQNLKLEADFEIFQEGDPSEGIYLVLEGAVLLTKPSRGERPIVIAEAKSGDYFGEMGVFDGEGRSTGAITKVASDLAIIPGEPLIKLLNQAPGHSAMTFMHRILTNLRTTNHRYIHEVIHKEKLTTVGEMAGKIIHDLRGPLTSMTLGTELLTMSQSPEDMNRTLRMLQHQIKRMNNLAEELLEFSRGNYELKKFPVDISDPIENFCILNHDFLDSKKVEVVLQCESVLVNLDQNKFIRVLQNLLNNAVDILEGKPSPTIRITASKTAKGARVVFSDNGPGIPAVIKDRIFESFVTHGKAGGTGLGLAIVKSIVQAHGGSITLESKPGAGATFIIDLPA